MTRVSEPLTSETPEVERKVAPEPASAAPTVGRRRWIQAAAGVLGGSAATLLVRSRLTPPAAQSSAPEGATAAPVPELDATSQGAPEPAPAPLFSRVQAALVEVLAEHVLPEGDRPGATSAGVPAYIEDIVREVYDEPERQAFLHGIDALDAEARARHGRAFVECDAVEREALLALGLERCAPSFDTGEPWCFFQAFRALTIEGFCQSRLGATRVLQYEAVPGEYRGCVPSSEVGRAWATS